jgi:hypothetical protein
MLLYRMQMIFIVLKSTSHQIPDYANKWANQALNQLQLN